VEGNLAHLAHLGEVFWLAFAERQLRVNLRPEDVLKTEDTRVGWIHCFVIHVCSLFNLSKAHKK